MKGSMAQRAYPLVLLGIFVSLISSAQSEAPYVSNIKAEQRPGTRLVDIYYDLEDSESNFVTISVRLVDSDGQRYNISKDYLTGDVGDVSPGENKHIVWDAGEDIPNVNRENNRIEVKADDKSGDGETITVNLDNLPSDATPLVMVLIPQTMAGGEFKLGSPGDEVGRGGDEGNDKAELTVKISKDFYLGKYEVTLAQWQAVMGSIPKNSSGDGMNYPVNWVSWDNCQDFIKELNTLGQGTFRLPTEAEWEYACRAGTDNRFDRFYWGKDENYTDIDEYAWYSGNSNSKIHEAGTRKPNNWELYDMSGNVREWCQDWYIEYIYKIYSSLEKNLYLTDPVGPDSGEKRVSRGGYYNSAPQNLRSACRYSWDPKSSNESLGLRVVLEKN